MPVHWDLEPSALKVSGTPLPLQMFVRCNLTFWGQHLVKRRGRKLSGSTVSQSKP